MHKLKQFIKKSIRVAQTPFILADYKAFKKALTAKHPTDSHTFEISLKNAYPCIRDKTITTGFDRHYVYHTAWAARKVKEISPEFHVDISSSLYFCGIVSAFVPVHFYDYRPAKLNLSGLESKEGDLMHLPFADNSVSSISCMHTIEHIGLGRYGDTIDPEGDLKAIHELIRVTKPGGSILFVTPIGGKAQIEYNAHRIYTYDYILKYFEELELTEFSFIPEHEAQGGLITNATKEVTLNEKYGCGCFWFKKNNTDMTDNQDFFIVRFRGGLGNQLFQYATARIYSLKTGRPFKADTTGYNNPENQKVPRGYKLPHFNINLPIATNAEVQALKYPLGVFSKMLRGFKSKVLKLDYLDYHPELLHTKIDYLDGYFQSPLYYTGYEETIKKECSVKIDQISVEAKEIEKQIQQTTSVSVHIRRGDLVTELAAAQASGLASLNYYEEAVGKMSGTLSIPTAEDPTPAKPIFYIFSDDIYWVKDNMNFPEGTIFVSVMNFKDYEEFQLISACKHNIIGNSTFSWWAAWINKNPNKVVMAPRQWTVRNTEHPSIIPSTWIKL